MRLRRIRAAGFRGIRGAIDIEVPAGFLVVTGRNGTGKTTLCDAIEYALTGTIERYFGKSEDRESLDEYIWWRGDEPASDHFVELELVSDDGNTVVVRRDRKTVSRDLDATLFCDVELAPDGWAAQMCRTSIIRDDTIASFSFDLAETDRFQFVQASMGSTDINKYTEVLRECEKRIEQRRTEVVNAYNATRDRAIALREEISGVKARLASREDVARAEIDLKSITATGTGATIDLVAKGRDLIVTLRQRETVLLDLARMVEQRAKVLQSLGHDFADHLAEMRAAITELEKQVADAEAAVAEAARGRAKVADAQPLIAAMASLARDAEIVGLIDGHCAVCRSAVSREQLRAGTEQLRRLVEEQSAAIAQATDQTSSVESHLAHLRRELAGRRNEQARTAADVEILNAEKEKFAEMAARARFDPAISATRESIEETISAVRQQILTLQRAIATIEAHAETGRIADLERLLETVQRESEDLVTRQTRLENAREHARSISRTVRRIAGEVLEDKLAGLAPLLSDLYLRIRPHSEWREVQYHLRGDVRRFLSLRVGPDLNPRFMFSSGQRRATGLAFLLSVHLSRTWCRLNSLVLDDPVQHIDDFRALHLVEVLSAIRQTGKQIVCSVEDPDLARLLARRLRPDFDQEGGIVELTRDARGDIVVTPQRVHPLGRVLSLAARSA